MGKGLPLEISNPGLFHTCIWGLNLHSPYGVGNSSQEVNVKMGSKKVKPLGLPAKGNTKLIRNKPSEPHNIQNILKHTKTHTNKYILAANELTVKNYKTQNKRVTM